MFLVAPKLIFECWLKR